jgi:hypothetical protein
MVTRIIALLCLLATSATASLRVGTNSVTDVRVGTNLVQYAYAGTNLVWQRTAAWTPASLSPVTWYKADGDTVDAGSANTNAIWVNGAVYTNGVNGQAFAFLGVSNYLYSAYSEQANETFCAWVCPRANTAVKLAFATRSVIPGDSVPGIGVAFEQTAGKQELYAANGYRVPLDYTKGQWRHVAATFTNGVWTVWTNGVNAGTYSGTRTTGKAFVAFGINGAVTTFFDGAVDDFMKFNRVLTTNEIQQIYNWRQ